MAGGIDNKTAATGPLLASQSATGPADAGIGAFSGSARARADYWSLGVSASGTMTGGTSAFNHHQAASFARFLVPVTLTSPGIATGTPGAVDFGFLIEGSMQSLRNAPYSQVAETRLGIRVDGQPFGVWDSFRVVVSDDALPTVVMSGSTGLPGAFVLGAGSLSGSANVTSTARFAMQWGVPFTVEVALRTSVGPCCYGASLSSDFFNTATLSDIRAYSSAGQVLDFSGVDGEGHLLGPSGLVAAVPEPGSQALMLAGVVALAGAACRRSWQHS